MFWSYYRKFGLNMKASQASVANTAHNNSSGTLRNLFLTVCAAPYRRYPLTTVCVLPPWGPPIKRTTLRNWPNSWTPVRRWEWSPDQPVNHQIESCDQTALIVVSVFQRNQFLEAESVEMEKERNQIRCVLFFFPPFTSFLKTDSGLRIWHLYIFLSSRSIV